MHILLIMPLARPAEAAACGGPVPRQRQAAASPAEALPLCPEAAAAGVFVVFVVFFWRLLIIFVIVFCRFCYIFWQFLIIFVIICLFLLHFLQDFYYAHCAEA